MMAGAAAAPDDGMARRQELASESTGAPDMPPTLKWGDRYFRGDAVKPSAFIQLVNSARPLTDKGRVQDSRSV